MQSVVFVTILLAAIASASQPEQGPNGSPVQPQNGVPVVQNAPVIAQPSIGSQPVEVAAPVNGEQPQPGHQHHQHPHHPSFASYYAPAGMVNVVGGEHGPNKPAAVRGYEQQYGQPESASLPPNYKPFGSWGLYIGGNPADGYYTNYYKALGHSVDKPQQVGAVEQMKPAVSSQTAAFSPVLRQASSSPYVGSDHYPFAYSPSELNSGAYGPSAAPVHANSPFYSPANFDQSSFGVSPYADSYATKKVGAAYAQKEATQKEVFGGSTKGYQQQSRVYVYPSPVAASPAAPVSVQPQQQHQQQVVSYPVPVGSQIVGSQPGVDGAFNPYGVHAFTRYAVRPTVVGQQQDSSTYYYGYGTGAQQAQPVYAHSYPHSGSAYYPMSFYGYPLNQLHYSQGSVSPQSVHGQEQQQPHHAPVQPNQMVAASEKQESEDKSPKQMNKA